MGDLINLMHLPYTGIVLSFVIFGALAAPRAYPDRLVATLVAYFLGLGIGAHSLDQLEPNGSHYVQSLNRRELAIIGSSALVGAVAVGAYYATTVTPSLLVFIFVGLFFAFAYALPTFVAGGLFHNNVCFAFAWGYLPYLTSYYVNSQSISPIVLLGGLPLALAAFAEISLSRSARKARKQDLPPAAYAPTENALKLLVALVYLSAATSVLLRLA
jgi:1,4-dihydroxy-2-naphthoate octaprenyltransferase